MSTSDDDFDNLGPPPGADAPQGVRARWARRRARIKQTALATMIGMKQPSVAKFEKGISRTNKKITLIAQLTGVSALWLTEGYGSPDRVAPPGPTDSHETLALQQFGLRVARKRKELGLSRAELGLGVLDPDQVGDLEAGRLWPGPVALDVIAMRLRESLDWLVGGAVSSHWRGPNQDPDLSSRFHDRA